MHRIEILGIAGVVAALAAVTPRAASACGASGASGVTASACSLDEHAFEVAPKWRGGVAASLTATTLHFGDVHVDAVRELAIATLDRRMSSRTTLQFGAGALVGGHLEVAGTRFDVRPGAAVVAGVVHRFVDADGARPFVLGGAELAVVAAPTRGPADEAATYAATDLRFTGALGWTIARRLSPYVVGRAFGGPIWWSIAGETRTGTDAYHVQLGAGAVASLGAFDLGVEGVPLGERAASATLGLAF